ncbi:Hypothetical protein ZAZAV_9 [Cedratvirus Zaza IHUMI]|uniref:Uncharacterized protein n=1 Tax=Cedratvirus Zaza IHUMI TaxID=2126979 RepID=A0A2R8FCQ8_9VIRU|nr:Hypothetical protein ZAZAV_9 [Cedratvirus Zaza IHUMI]
MDKLDILSMLDNTSMTVFYPHDVPSRFGTVFITAGKEVISKEDLERGYMDKDTFLSKYGHLVSPDMIGPNSYLVRYTWVRCSREDGTFESMEVEDVRVLVQ